MNRSFVVCLLAASIAAPTACYSTTSHLAERMNPAQASVNSTSLEDVSSAAVKPGKSKKYKKKMSKQMKKRKRH